MRDILLKILRQDGFQFRYGFLRPEFLVGEEGILQRGVGFPIWFRRNLRDGGGDNFLRRVGIAMEIGDDHFERDVFVFLPAIVIGGHRERGVGDLGFAGALGLAEIRHADDVVAGGVIGEGFGAGAEGRTFHIHIRAAVVRVRVGSNGGA